MGYVLLAFATLGVLFVGSVMLSLNPVPMAFAAMQSDESRLAAIAGSGSSSDGLHTLYQKVKLNNRDVKLIRQDVRSAMAAYPDLDEDKLLTGRWFAFDEAARVPSKGFGNSHGTQDPITKEYYLESAYMSVVRSEYPNRADEATTAAFFAARKAKRDADRYAQLKAEGPFTMWGGSGGSMSVRLDKKTGKVVVERSQEWANTGKRWTMPFVIEEWVDVNASDLDAIKKLPSFAQAVEEDVAVKPSGVTIGPVTNTGRPFNGTLMPGESTSVGVNLR